MECLCLVLLSTSSWLFYSLRSGYILVPALFVEKTILSPLNSLVVFVHLLNRVWLFATPWTAAARLLCPPLSSRVCSDLCSLSWWCCLTISSSAALFFSCLQSFPAWGSFRNESTLHISWPKYWHQSFQWIFKLISFRTDWFGHLAVQGTLKSLL